MRNAIEDLKNGKFLKRDEIADLEIYQLDEITYCLPINSSPKLRQYLVTAILAYKNNKKFDEILPYQPIENYEDECWIDNKLAVCYFLAAGVDISVNILNDLQIYLKNNGRKLTLGETIFFSTLIRLQASFKSALILSKRGFFVEIMPILRLIYEQLCWACYTIDKTGNEIEKNGMKWMTKNTKYLKEKIGKGYGKFYSQLSSEAHMALNEMGKFHEQDEDGRLFINNRSGKKSKKEIKNIIILYKLYLNVLNYGIHYFENSEQSYYIELIEAQFGFLKEINKIYEGNEKKFKFTIRV